MDDIIYANGNWEDDNSFATSDELADLVQRLHSILLASNTGKHTPYIIARKEVVFPVINALMGIVSSLPNDMPKSCSDCPLKRHADDVRIANKTLDRLMNGDSTVTRDEAVNLHKLIWQAYNNGV